MLNLETPRGPLVIRATRETDIDAFRDLRLQALREHPEAFASDFEDGRKLPREHWLERMRSNERQITFVVESPAAAALAGMTGIYRDGNVKLHHSADIWGVYVRPEWRGMRLSEALIGQCINWARDHDVRIVRLSVVTTNLSAIRCYQRCGFEQYGLAAEVIRANDRYYDEILMARRP